MEKLADLSKTYLPTVAVTGIVLSLVTGTFYFGKLDERICQLEKRTEKLEEMMIDIPTRREFDQIGNQIAELKISIKEVMDYLKNN
ncbi:MAG TPA: hypothetical protein VJL60_03055 [Gammaproteobacteria bacterium]|nr:hypothetical protein [Gammaproteobacteria bacterium]